MRERILGVIGRLGLWVAVCLPVTDRAADTPPAGSEVRVLLMEVSAASLRTNPEHCGFIGMSGTGSAWSADATMIRLLIAQSKSCQVSSNVKDGVVDWGIVGLQRIDHVHAVDRVANAPPGRTTTLAFNPRVASVKNGTECSVSTETDPQNFHVRLAVKDSRMIGMETTRYTESIQGIAPRPGPLGRLYPHEVGVTVQIPIVQHGQAEGSWTLPKDRALVVGLGPYRDSDTFELRERVVVVCPPQLINVESIERLMTLGQSSSRPRGAGSWTAIAGVVAALLGVLVVPFVFGQWLGKHC